MKDPIQNVRRSAPFRDDRYGVLFEVAGPVTGLPNLGVAWVEIDPRAASPAHYHKVMSEVYYIIEGAAIMTLDGKEQSVGPGDCISIAPGVVHAIRNDGDTVVRFVCATSPSYHEDDDFEV
jgi:mannose-6-phosphate isomerase-like protein (cupin superfamily)